MRSKNRCSTVENSNAVFTLSAVPKIKVRELKSNYAKFDLEIDATERDIQFEVNGAIQKDSTVVLEDLLEMREYLVRARACFVGGICGDENYYTFSTAAGEKVSVEISALLVGGDAHDSTVNEVRSGRSILRSDALKTCFSDHPSCVRRIGLARSSPTF